MTGPQWEMLLRVINGETVDPLPTGFIIDSPWLPGWFGCSTLDYYTNDAIWFEANRKAIETFPDTLFLPGFWSEYGMCTEPSAFGAKCRWEEANLPHAEMISDDIDVLCKLPKPNVRKDGLLPFMINRLKNMQPQINDMGHEIKFAVARGPLNIASFLMGTTELMMAMMEEPEKIPVAGKIIWITPKGAQGARAAGIGVQFSEQDGGAAQKKIETYLAGALTADRPTHTM